MIFIADFSPILPDFGIFFWTTLIFLLILLFLGRYAFRPIQKALKDREDSIQEALDQAKKAKEEMEALQNSNEQLLKEAQEERSNILKEAKETKDAIIKEAKEKAKTEAQKIVDDAKKEIENMKASTLTSVKNELGGMAISIAEKVIRQQMAGEKAQENLVKQLVDDLSL